MYFNLWIGIPSPLHVKVERNALFSAIWYIRRIHNTSPLCLHSCHRCPFLLLALSSPPSDQCSQPTLRSPSCCRRRSIGGSSSLSVVALPSLSPSPPPLHLLSTPSPPPLTPLLAPCSDQRPDRPQRHRAAVGEGRPARVHLLSVIAVASLAPSTLSRALSPLSSPPAQINVPTDLEGIELLSEKVDRWEFISVCCRSPLPLPLSTPSPPPLTPLLAPCSDQRPDRPRGHRAAVGEGRSAGVHLCLSSLSPPSPPLQPLSTPSHPSPRPLLRSTSRPTSKAPSCCRRRSTGGSSSTCSSGC